MSRRWKRKEDVSAGGQPELGGRVVGAFMDTKAKEGTSLEAVRGKKGGGLKEKTESSSGGKGKASAARRQHIFLTGQPGVGKSTMVRRCVERLGSERPDLAEGIRGFFTEEVRRGGEREGFDVVLMGKGGRLGKRAPLSRVGSGKPAVGKYKVDVDSFESVGVREISEAASEGHRQGSGAGEERERGPFNLLVLDEIGKMELLCPSFMPAVTAAFTSGAVILGTVPMPRYGRTVVEVEEVKAREGVKLFEVTRQNRDELFDVVFAHLVACLEGKGEVKKKADGKDAEIGKGSVRETGSSSGSSSSTSPPQTNPPGSLPSNAAASSSSSLSAKSDPKTGGPFVHPLWIEREEREGRDREGKQKKKEPVRVPVLPSVLLLGEGGDTHSSVGYAHRPWWTLLSKALQEVPGKKNLAPPTDPLPSSSSSPSSQEASESARLNFLGSAGMALWDLHVLSGGGGSENSRDVVEGCEEEDGGVRRNGRKRSFGEGEMKKKKGTGESKEATQRDPEVWKKGRDKKRRLNDIEGLLSQFPSIRTVMLDGEETGRAFRSGFPHLCELEREERGWRHSARLSGSPCPLSVVTLPSSDSVVNKKEKSSEGRGSRAMSKEKEDEKLEEEMVLAWTEALRAALVKMI